MIIGGHVSAAGGLHNAVANAINIGATCMQIFGASPRQWNTKIPDQNTIAIYKSALAKSPIKAVYLHAAYLINLASPDERIWLKSVQCLSGHLAIAEAMDADGVVFHIGSNSGGTASREEALDRVAEGVCAVLKAVPGKAFLTMENSAGGGTKLGVDLDEVAYLFKKIKSPQARICLDTAHAFGAGILSYGEKEVGGFFDSFDSKIGLENLAVLHVNDSKTPFGSYTDRHENIGEGYIGLKGFKNLAAEKRLHDKAWILEVPGFDDEGPDKKNMDILKYIIQRDGSKNSI